ncbi:hypothetical protein PUR28_01310, partial [Streptomyces sp. BE308]|uniref:hypothetical protein n=1 Tax=Streptomyces sp. BE308 TaxID=3002529 RepID=UPI002E79DE94
WWFRVVLVFGGFFVFFVVGVRWVFVGGVVGVFFLVVWWVLFFVGFLPGPPGAGGRVCVWWGGG